MGTGYEAEEDFSCQLHAQSERRAPRPIECRDVNFRANASYSLWGRHYKEVRRHLSLAYQTRIEFKGKKQPE